MDREFFICACDAGPTGGVYRFELQGKDFIALLGFTPLPTCSWIAANADWTRFYASARRDDEAVLASFRRGKSGALEPMNELKTRARSITHIAVSPDRRFVYCANYHDGSVTEVALREDGSLDRVAKTIRHEGSGPNAERQGAAHPHCVLFSPDEAFLCVADLGADALFLYPYEPGAGIREDGRKKIPSAPGEGPRHLLFDKAGTTAYVSNELGNSVAAYTYSEGSMTRLGAWSSLPEDCAVPSKCGAIRMTPDGSRVLVSNRGADSIAVFVVLAPDKLKLQETFSCCGSQPRDFNFLPDATMIASANEASNTVSLFHRAGGAIEPAAERIAGLPRPLCILSKEM